MSRMEAAEEAIKTAPDDLVVKWAAGDPAATKRVDELLASAGLTMDSVVARAVANELNKIERLNDLITSAEWRRNTLLREVDRRRASFAQKLRSEIGKIEDAEFTIDAGTDTAKQNAIAAA